MIEFAQRDEVDVEEIDLKIEQNEQRIRGRRWSPLLSTRTSSDLLPL